MANAKKKTAAKKKPAGKLAAPKVKHKGPVKRAGAPKAVAKKSNPAMAALVALATELRGLMDDVRVRLHLAGMDVRGSWEELSKQAQHLSSQLERAAKDVGKSALTQEARLRVHLAVMEAKEQWTHLQPRLATVTTSLQKLGDEAIEGLRELPSEQLKLQAALAQMNATTAIEQRTTEARAQLGKAKNAAEKLLHDATKTVHSAVKDLRGKIAK